MLITDTNSASNLGDRSILKVVNTESFVDQGLTIANPVSHEQLWFTTTHETFLSFSDLASPLYGSASTSTLQVYYYKQLSIEPLTYDPTPTLAFTLWLDQPFENGGSLKSNLPFAPRSFPRISRAFYRLTLHTPDGIEGIITTIKDSEYFFGLQPSCFVVSNPPASFYHPTGFTSTCPPPSACLPSGACSTLPDTTKPIIVDPTQSQACSVCDQTNTQVCNPSLTPTTGLCQCRGGWSGPYCEQSSQCTENADDICARPDNGFVATKSPPQQLECSSQCSCYNSWVGARCELCFLECNHGMPYRDCARCGCNTGYSGARCDCRALTGRITLSATNPILIETQGKIGHNSNQLFTIDAITGDRNWKPSSLLSSSLSDEENQLIHIAQDLFQDFSTTLTQYEITNLVFNMVPDSTTNPSMKTIFTFLLKFGCPEASPIVNNSDELQNRWNQFSTNFSTLSSVKTHFGSGVESIPGPIEPVPESLPPEDERFVEEENEANQQLSLSILSVILIIASVIV